VSALAVINISPTDFPPRYYGPDSKKNICLNKPRSREFTMPSPFESRSTPMRSPEPGGTAVKVRLSSGVFTNARRVAADMGNSFGSRLLSLISSGLVMTSPSGSPKSQESASKSPNTWPAIGLVQRQSGRTAATERNIVGAVCGWVKAVGF
jgi:hypothetical protein